MITTHKTGLAGIAALALGLTLIAPPHLAWAQTASGTPAPTGEAAPSIESVKTTIKVRPLLLTEVPLNEPRAIDLGALSLPGVSPTLTEGVTVKAYTRYVEFEGQRIAQVVLAGVEKNGAQEPLPASAFSAQFTVQEPRLDPAIDVVIQGDQATIIAALERLAAAAPEQAPVDEQQQVVAQDNQKAQQQNSDAANGNDQAASWQSPDPVNVAAEPVENTIITTDNCPIKPYIERMEAVQLSKTVTMKNGTIMSESDCTDSNETMPIQRSYLLCSYDENTDPAVRAATGRYQLFYVDPAGNRQDVQNGDCINDPEKVFPIVEKACPIYLDYTAGAEKAVPQSALVYLNDNNREVQVRGCQASETIASVDMTPTTNGCSIRDDFSKNESYRQSKFTYQLDGITYQAGDCADDGTKYPQTKVYADAGGTVLCAPVTDANGVPTALQSRIKINVNGIDDYRTPCAPDASGSVTISATTNNCDNPAMWEHNLATGQSYGMERYYFMDGATPRYVTQCQKNTTMYPHQQEITGYQPHDGQLFAYPLTTVYITPPTGRYNIKTSEVLQGAVQQPYELTGTSTVANGQASYVGCDKYAETDLVEQWKRPDLTVYQKAIGSGTPVGPTYSCAGSGATAAADWTKMDEIRGCSVGGCTGYSDGICNRWLNSFYKNGLYQATRSLKRDDGVVISSQTKSVVAPPACKVASSNSNNNPCYISNVDSFVGFNICPANPPTATDIGALKSIANFLY